jgi:Histidine kinase-, DNA gyrase B-, and HSP90-like ATPase
VRAEQVDEYEISEPHAAALVESLRAFGYSPEAAIADLVDNSLSAGARRIDIAFHWAGRNSTVRVLDDGYGMTDAVLASAMRPGSTNPLEERAAGDLGRFGLGLKTASFSQARELTVVSRTKASQSKAVRRWDLDTVAATCQWRLLLDEPSDYPVDLPKSGTVVQWSKLDRLVGDVDPTDVKAHNLFTAMIDRVRKHLEATFQRFLGGRGKVTITVNGSALVPWDPFMTAHSATQQLETEELPYRGELVVVRGYVLPHRSKLDDAGEGAGIAGWNQQQGFYVYRSGRLLIAGDWLALGLSKDEHTKLARISVDFPASLDHEWQVDVRKSTARPPGELIDDLRRIARATRSKAEEVYRHRGKLIAHRTSQEFVFAWQQYKGRDGSVRYRVNREHPVIKALYQAVGAGGARTVDQSLRFIEETVPTTLIGVAISEAVDTQPQPFGDDKKEVMRLAEFTVDTLLATPGSTLAEVFDHISAAEPFSQYPEVIQAIREKRT